MSRIGRKPIIIPEKVEVSIEAQNVKIKGPKGEISQKIPSEILVEIHPHTKRGQSVKGAKIDETSPRSGVGARGNEILVFPKKGLKKVSALWGLTRALLQNHVKGVIEGFEKQLEMRGIGYKAVLKDEKVLQLAVGFSHLVNLEIPEELSVSLEKNIITVSGIDKQKVGEFAAEIRAVRKPEPYKGKGIRYVGEKVRKKEGKKAVTATA